MDFSDKFLISEYVFIAIALSFAYFVLAPMEQVPLEESMQKMRGYVEETGIQMHEVELILRNETLVPDERNVVRAMYSHIDYDQVAGYAQYAGNESQIVMRNDYITRQMTIAHEYAHHVMYAKGVWEGHHDMSEFWMWENCLYLSMALNTNLCWVV